MYCMYLYNLSSGIVLYLKKEMIWSMSVGSQLAPTDSQGQKEFNQGPQNIIVLRYLRDIWIQVWPKTIIVTSSEWIRLLISKKKKRKETDVEWKLWMVLIIVWKKNIFSVMILVNVEV